MREEYPDKDQRAAVCHAQTKRDDEGAAVHYPAICRAVYSTVWAIIPEKLTEIVLFLDAKRRGEFSGAVALLGPKGRHEAGAIVANKIAVVPIVGTISQRIGLMEDASGGVSTDRIGSQLEALALDPEVSGIVLDIDSPGGTVYGVPELAAKVFALRAQKPVWAVANSLMASAAYWIGSAAKELIVTPSGEAGSIGAMAVHADMSAANEAAGVRYTYITSAAHKAELSPDSPPSEEALAELQRRVNEVGEMFVRDVARNRGVTPTVVRKDYGQGRTFGAKEAVERGLADRVGTLGETITRMQDVLGRKRRNGTTALRRRLDIAEQS